MPVEDPDAFSGRFSQTLLHQDLGTSLPQKSLNLGNKKMTGLRTKYLVKILEPISKQSKCPWQRCETIQNTHILRACSAFSPFRAPDSRDFAKLNLLFVEPESYFRDRF